MRESLRYRRLESFVVFSFFLVLQIQPLRDLILGCHWVLRSLVLGLQSEQLHQLLSYCCDLMRGQGKEGRLYFAHSSEEYSPSW